MSKLLSKYEDFLEELNKTVEPLEEVVEESTFTKEECHTIANFCAGATSIIKDEVHYKDAIEAIERAVEFFKEK